MPCRGRPHPPRGSAASSRSGAACGAAVGPQLFNLAEDLVETRNVAADHPEIVKDLSDPLAQMREKGRTRP